MFQNRSSSFSVIQVTPNFFIFSLLAVFFFAFGLTSVLFGSIFPNNRIIEFLNDSVRFLDLISFNGNVTFNSELKTTIADFTGNLSLDNMTVNDIILDNYEVENLNVDNFTLNGEFDENITINNFINATNIITQNLTTTDLEVTNEITSSSQTTFSSTVIIENTSSTYIEFFDIGNSRPLLFAGANANPENGGQFFIDQTDGIWNVNINSTACLTGTPSISNQFLFVQPPFTYGGFTVTGFSEDMSFDPVCSFEFQLPDITDGFTIGNGPSTIVNGTGNLGSVVQTSASNTAEYRYLRISNSSEFEITTSLYFSYYNT